MKVLILGAGMMGRAIAFDLSSNSDADEIILAERNPQIRKSAARFLKTTPTQLIALDVEKNNMIKDQFRKVDVVISAVPYHYNLKLATLAIQSHANFIDLGGNNDIVQKERKLFSKAKKANVIVIPDSGLAPGLVSILTRDIVDHLDDIDFVKLRVGGVPRNPQPPLNYQIVFSPHGLINEYVEDALVLSHGTILKKKSLTERETITFPQPFGRMEAFLTSGGCSTLPMTYQQKIEYLDYKTIRYPGHCEIMKAILDLGFASERKINCGTQQIAPRDVFAQLLEGTLPKTGEDVVLLKVFSQGIKNDQTTKRDYSLIDYYDRDHDISAMMRTTGYPVAITAQMILDGTLTSPGVYCPEEILPPALFFSHLKKRGITLTIHERRAPS
jgi:lysine 6-dehydrogenase